jgi:hypothetical protein
VNTTWSPSTLGVVEPAGHVPVAYLQHLGPGAEHLQVGVHGADEIRRRQLGGPGFGEELAGEASRVRNALVVLPFMSISSMVPSLVSSPDPPSRGAQSLWEADRSIPMPDPPLQYVFAYTADRRIGRRREVRILNEMLRRECYELLQSRTLWPTFGPAVQRAEPSRAPTAARP